MVLKINRKGGGKKKRGACQAIQLNRSIDRSLSVPIFFYIFLDIVLANKQDHKK